MVAQIICCFIHIGLCYFFVMHKGLGVVGLGLASSCSNTVKFFIIFTATYCNKELGSAMRSPFTSDTFKGWYTYLSLSLPAALILGSEWWAYELITVFSGWIGIEELAAQTLVTSGIAVFFEVPLGLAESTAALLGNCIGANNKAFATKFVRVTTLITLCAIVTITCSLITGRGLVIRCFSSSEEVMVIADKLLIVVAILFFFDGS